MNATTRFKGNGVLDNIIGNPLETTLALSHLIFEGPLDQFPGLKICTAHAGGYLPSYAGALGPGLSQAPSPCPLPLRGRGFRKVSLVPSVGRGGFRGSPSPSLRERAG
jgi:hypothetical protein